MQTAQKLRLVSAWCYLKVGWSRQRLRQESMGSLYTNAWIRMLSVNLKVLVFWERTVKVWGCSQWFLSISGASRRDTRLPQSKRQKTDSGRRSQGGFHIHVVPQSLNPHGGEGQGQGDLGGCWTHRERHHAVEASETSDFSRGCRN